MLLCVSALLVLPYLFACFCCLSACLHCPPAFLQYMPAARLLPCAVPRPLVLMPPTLLPFLCPQSYSATLSFCPYTLCYLPTTGTHNLNPRFHIFYINPTSVPRHPPPRPCIGSYTISSRPDVSLQNGVASYLRINASTRTYAWRASIGRYEDKGRA